MTSAPLTPDEAAAAIVTLINASPRTPSVVEIASVITRATAVPLASPLTLALRRLRPVLDAAIAEELDAEKTPAYEAACAKSRRLDQEFAGLSAQAWDRPVGHCERDDLAMRCEAALAYFARNADGTLLGLNGSCPFERSLAQLLVAVAAFTGCRIAREVHHG